MIRPRIALVGASCSLAVMLSLASTVEGAGSGLGARDRHVPFPVNGTSARVAAFEKDGLVKRLYGEAFSRGPSAEASAEAFLGANVDLLGVEREDLVPSAIHVQPIMYDRATGTYKFTRVAFDQVRDGLPVFGSRLTLLVRNEADHPLVLANTDVRSLGDFRAGLAAQAPLAAAIRDSALARAAERSELVGEVRLVSTQRVIWAGIDDEVDAPRLAEVLDITVDAEEWRIVCDVATGAILHEELRTCTVDLTGNVSGLVTEGIGAEQCEAEVSTPLPHLRVTAGGGEAYTDVNGDYTITGLLGNPVTVAATLSGQWFDVFTAVGSVESLSQGTTPPGTVDFVFNAANADEFIRAQSNAYQEANIVRDLAVAANPLYPTLSDGGFPVYVNRSDVYCPGNAWYSPSEVSINFCRTGSGYPNTAWSSVIHHEYGHHLVEAGGSGQGQYGEGTGDVMSVLLGDSPLLGFGFFGDCATALRNADNSYQYPCNGEAHDCGQLISGCVWDTRNALTFTEPVHYLEILSDLYVNSILLHSGSTIDPSITIDLLTLDDDNGNILDGTPHYQEIATGFGAHNMDAPALALLVFNFPSGLPDLVSPAGNTTVRVEVSGVAGTPEPDTGVLYFDDGGGTVQIPMTQVMPNVYDATFPAADCGTPILYYFTARTTSGQTQSWPVDAPAVRFSTVAATGINVVESNDFESTGGWTVENVALDDGQWDRGVPVGGGDRGDPPTDYDGSGACWLTDNVDDNSDVDGGPTRLLSDVFDLSGAAGAFISYARWFDNDDNDIDRLDVHISNNGGTSWTLVESVGDQDGWEVHSFRAADFVTPTNQMRLRFSATDNPNDSVTEAGIDDLRIIDYTCEVVCPQDVDGSGDVGFNDVLEVLSNWGPCVGCPADITGDDEVGFDDLLEVLANWGPC